MSHQRNLDRLAAVATALGELNKDVVYVGGATVSLYVPVLQTAYTRPTDDVDVVVELATYGAYNHLYNLLTTKGFIQSHNDEVICRFRLQGFIVDIMSTQDIGMGSSNRWYQSGFTAAIWYDIKPNLAIRIFPPSYFLATKLEAFFSRGYQDPYASKDFEDIVFLIDYCPNLIESVNQSDDVLRQHLAVYAQRLQVTRNLDDIVLGHISGRHQEERTRHILAFFDDLASNN
ncbi:hypothetical protein [Spirosoma litoris]